MYIFYSFITAKVSRFPETTKNNAEKNQKTKGLAPPHAKPAPLLFSYAKLSRSPSVLLQSAAPRVWRQSTVARDFTLGPDPSKHSTLLWGLTPESSLRLIRRPVTRVIRATRSTTAAVRLTLGSSNLSLGLVSPAELHILLQLFAGEVARRLSQ